MIRKAIRRNKPFKWGRITLANVKMLSSDTFPKAKEGALQQAGKAARRKEEKIYGPRLMGKLESQRGGNPTGAGSPTSLEMRFYR